MSSARSSMEKSKPAKKRRWRLYSKSVQDLPGIATAIQAGFTVDLKRHYQPFQGGVVLH
ncbi:hypothetical protein QUF75_01760 [Desulfococcaceae bacterium HSG7]|nr:hypothetical protein [Desulfococcaceae bacterium HSG7]